MKLKSIWWKAVITYFEYFPCGTDENHENILVRITVARAGIRTGHLSNTTQALISWTNLVQPRFEAGTFRIQVCLFLSSFLSFPVASVQVCHTNSLLTFRRNPPPPPPPDLWEEGSSGWMSFWSLSIIWYSKEHNASETGSVSVLRWKGGRHVGPLLRANEWSSNWAQLLTELSE
jgi:hypothetical protein